MLCNRSAGRLILCLTNVDFQFNDWKSFIADLKFQIPSRDREYDPELRQWYIKASEYNISIVRQLADRYFPSEG